ncbi:MULTISPECIES: hypothetical protein [Methylomonas]|uniref:DUF2185 domain-containing protein n=2 Tax=Methylomonas TaxID=416 RepID=A0A126T5F0_9GAMM|nr:MULTISPECIES: hypothetical protein [Methylomonas]AMK77298.1 hypothetical protein JT25_012560 [Methylomonas denitrificans]OAH97798.1 hypothetical protein A1342_15360 [Methylomonas methanica]TCV77523.1 hypothetical protein EDE11_12726 [Methylomonas methanica]
MNKNVFDISEDTVVVTSTYIVKEKMPILYVMHEFDEVEGVIWQFHSGNNDYETDKILLVSLKNILNIDTTISDVSNLPVGFIARRKFIGDEWVFCQE